MTQIDPTKPCALCGGERADGLQTCSDHTYDFWLFHEKNMAVFYRCGWYSGWVQKVEFSGAFRWDVNWKTHQHPIRWAHESIERPSFNEPETALAHVDTRALS